MRKFKIILLFLIVLLQLKGFCSSRDSIAEQKIEKQLEAINPKMVQFFRDGTIAMDKGEYALSDSLYTIVYNKVPTFDPLLRRLGQIRIQIGKIEEGIDFCEKAYSINNSAYNILSLASCYLSAGRESENYEQNLTKSLQLLKEAENLPNGKELDFSIIKGQVALELNDLEAFRNVTYTMIDRFPKEMVTHYYTAILASADEQWTKAYDEILEAQRLGLPEENVKQFLDSGVQSKVNIRNFIKTVFWVIILWIVGIIILFLIGKLLSNITLKSLEKQNNTNKLTKGLRSVYRWLINFSGIYYYVSLPIILILTIIIVVGLSYVFFLVGHIPVQLMFMLVVGSFISIYSMIRSLLIKVKYTDPGRELKIEEAPDLFKLTDEVADKIGTRPINEIRITPTTDMAVYERGSWRDKLQDKATRILIIGTGILKDFKKDEFSAVLAHEYGHFSHRDTAGGEVAMRVINDMNKYFYALYCAGQNVWWNIAFQFLRLYNMIFLRISHGATRMQEVMADRVSAQNYGKTAFKNGLIHVIKQEIEFTKNANFEINEAFESKRPLNNLYELKVTNQNEIEEEFNNSLNRTTSEFDTHPSPKDRFKYIDYLNDPILNGNNEKITDMFVNWEALTLEMTIEIQKETLKP
jgi:Zn-dependent protease with chaperone function